MTTAQTIDYWGVVQRSLGIVWKHKFLWFFGFFATVSGGNVLSWVDERGEVVRDYMMERVEVLAVLIVFVVLVWLVLFVMNLISKGALIAGASDAGQGGTRPTFEASWTRGLRAFLGMLTLLVMGLVAFLAMSLVCALVVVIPLAAGAPGIVVAIVIGAVLLVPYLGFLFLLAFTITYAERALVVDRAGILDALARGWELTRAHFWESMIVWLMVFLSGLVYFIGLIVVLLVAAVPFVLIGLASLTAGLVLGIPVGIAILALATGAFGTYSHAVWTLTYEDLRALGGDEAPTPSGAAAPPAVVPPGQSPTPLEPPAPPDPLGAPPESPAPPEYAGASPEPPGLPPEPPEPTDPPPEPPDGPPEPPGPAPEPPEAPPEPPERSSDDPEERHD